MLCHGEVAHVGIWLASAGGLLAWRGEWVTAQTALHQPTVVDVHAGRIALYESASRLCSVNDFCFSAPPGVEQIRQVRNDLLLLSSETNCLTRFDRRGHPLVTASVGIDPQDFCLLDGYAAVCGHLDGCIHLLRLPDLDSVAVIRMPGQPLRITASGRALTVLTLLQAEPAQTLLCRIAPFESAYAPVAMLGGWPGAVAVDSAGGIWAATEGALVHFPVHSVVPDATYHDFGLIRSMHAANGLLVGTDSVSGCCFWGDDDGQHGLQTHYRGDVFQCAFA